MNEHSYAWGKFLEAVKSMTSGTGSIHQRLADAYCFYLMVLNPNDIPPDLRNEYQGIVAVLKPNVRDGILSDVVTEDQATDVADKIVEIHEQLSQAQGAYYAEEDKPKVTTSKKAKKS